MRPPVGLAGIVTLELTTEPRVACLPEGHRLARRESVSVSDLLQEPIIAAPLSPGPWRGYWLLDEYRTGPAPIVAEARTRDAELHMVARGDGISITSAGAGRYYARPGVVFVPISDIPHCSVALAWWPESSAAIADLVERPAQWRMPSAVPGAAFSRSPAARCGGLRRIIRFHRITV